MLTTLTIVFHKSNRQPSPHHQTEKKEPVKREPFTGPHHLGRSSALQPVPCCNYNLKSSWLKYSRRAREAGLSHGTRAQTRVNPPLCTTRSTRITGTVRLENGAGDSSGAAQLIWRSREPEKQTARLGGGPCIPTEVGGEFCSSRFRVSPNLRSESKPRLATGVFAPVSGPSGRVAPAT